MTTPNKRGGKRPGAGRKPNPDKQPLEQVNLRMPPDKCAKLRLMAGNKGVSLGACVASLIP